MIISIECNAHTHNEIIHWQTTKKKHKSIVNMTTILFFLRFCYGFDLYKKKKDEYKWIFQKNEEDWGNQGVKYNNNDDDDGRPGRL